MTQVLFQVLLYFYLIIYLVSCGFILFHILLFLWLICTFFL